MKYVYAPGCALMIYKPELAEKVLGLLNESMGGVSNHLICCQHQPKLESGTRVINTCSGCNKRYKEDYEGISTISLWEILAGSKTFPYPDYKGMEMSIQDPCPTRSEVKVHAAVRTLLDRMNIKVIEPKNTGTKGTCCGDSFYGSLPVEDVKKQMIKRSGEMPCEEVVVYCVSCIKSMHIGGKKPRYVIDLLFGEATRIDTFEPDEWHNELQRFIDDH